MIKAYITQKSSEIRFKPIKINSLKPGYKGGNCNVVVDTSQQFQTHRGFGGAFTDSAAIAIDVLPVDKRKELIDAYFSKQGLCYNLARLPMHTTDFSTHSQTYIEDGDVELKTFDIGWDAKRLDFYKECESVSGGFFTMLATWTPPAFMKSNKELQHGGKLLPEYREAWAEYYCKFIAELNKRDIKIDCLSVQNEPEAVQRWESCIYTGEEEGAFIRDFLYPALVKNGYKDMKIVLWDHNRDALVRRVLASFSIEGVRDIVWGVGYHWYCSQKHDNLSVVHAICPEKALFLSECCVELAYDSTTGKSSFAGVWEHGERYGKQIINDLNNYSEGWIDWNLYLDEEGGPTYAKNFCEAPIMIDKATKEIFYNPSYFYIGHFSKYIVPGAKRVFCGNDCESMLYTVAYINPDGEKVVVIENTSSRRKNITLTVDGKYTEFMVRPHAIITLVIDE